MKNTSVQVFCFSLATILKLTLTDQPAVQLVKVTGANAGSNMAALNNKLFLQGTDVSGGSNASVFKKCAGKDFVQSVRKVNQKI